MRGTMLWYRRIRACSCLRSLLCRLTLFLFRILPFLPVGDIIEHAALVQIVILRKFLKHHLVELRRFIVVEHDHALIPIQPQELICLQQVTLGIASSLGIRTGCAVNRREQRHEGELVVGDRDGDLATFLCEVFGTGQVVAAHVYGLVKGVELIFPLHTGILFLPLGQGLYRQLHRHIEATDGIEHIGDAVHVADIQILFQTEVGQYRKTSAMKAGIVGKPGKGQREEQGTEKAIGAVLRGNDDKVGTGFLPGQQQVHIVVACDFIYQGVLKDCKPVAKADDNIAPEVFPCLQKQTVRPLCRMLRRKLCQNAVDLIDTFVGKDLIDVTKAALLDGQQVALGVLQITDIVDECHEQVQLRTAPEVVGLIRPGGVLDNGVGHCGHKVGIGVQIGQTVPPIRVSHIQKVDCLHVKASFPKIRRKHFKQLALWVCGNDRLQMGLCAVTAALRQAPAASLCAAHEEGYDKTPGLV